MPDRPGRERKDQQQTPKEPHEAHGRPAEDRTFEAVETGAGAAAGAGLGAAVGGPIGAAIGAAAGGAVGAVTGEAVEHAAGRAAETMDAESDEET